MYNSGHYSDNAYGSTSVFGCGGGCSSSCIGAEASQTKISNSEYSGYTGSSAPSHGYGAKSKHK
jgi:hypothetical protein